MKRKNAKRSARRKPHKRRSARKYTGYTNRLPSRLHMPLPQRYTGNFEISFYGKLTLTTSPAADYFVVNASSFYIPFDNAIRAFTGIAGSALVPATSALNAYTPLGYQIMLAMYQRCIVTHSKIDILLSPGAVLDIAQLVAYPVNSTDTITQDTNIAQSQPYAKSLVVSSNNMQRNNRLTLSTDHAKFTGVTKAYYESQNQTSLVAANTSVRYAILYQLFSGAAPTANMAIQVKLTQRVTLNDPDTLVT